MVLQWRSRLNPLPLGMCWALAIGLVLSASQLAWAQRDRGPEDPGFRTSLPVPQVVGIGLPWLDEGAKNRPDASWAWNTGARGGRMGLTLTTSVLDSTLVQKPGAVALPGKTLSASDLAQWDSGLRVSLAVLDGLEIEGGGGYSVINVRFAGEATSTRFTGFYLEGLLRYSIPLHDLITPRLEVGVRLMDVEEQNSGTFAYDARTFWGDFTIAFEAFREPENWTVDLYAGAGYHIYTGDIDAANFHLDAQDDIDVLWGVIFTNREQLRISLDARFPGAATARLTVSLLF